MPTDPIGGTPGYTYAPVPDTIPPSGTEMAPPHGWPPAVDGVPNMKTMAQGQDGFIENGECITQAYLSDTLKDPTQAGAVKAHEAMMQNCQAPCTPCSGFTGSANIVPRLKRDLMNKYQLNNDQASAIIGNLSTETGGFRQFAEGGGACNPATDSQIGAYRSGGVGWAQWTDRRNAFYNFTAKQPCTDPSSYAANKAFLFQELDNNYANQITRLKNGTYGDTISSMTSGFMSGTRTARGGYENPGVPNLSDRVRRAQAAASVASAAGGSSATTQQAIEQNARALGGTSAASTYQGSSAQPYDPAARNSAVGTAATGLGAQSQSPLVLPLAKATTPAATTMAQSGMYPSSGSRNAHTVIATALAAIGNGSTTIASAWAQTVEAGKTHKSIAWLAKNGPGQAGWMQMLQGPSNLVNQYLSPTEHLTTWVNSYFKAFPASGWFQWPGNASQNGANALANGGGGSGGGSGGGGSNAPNTEQLDSDIGDFDGSNTPKGVSVRENFDTLSDKERTKFEIDMGFIDPTAHLQSHLDNINAGMGAVRDVEDKFGTSVIGRLLKKDDRFRTANTQHHTPITQQHHSEVLDVGVPLTTNINLDTLTRGDHRSHKRLNCTVSHPLPEDTMKVLQQAKKQDEVLENWQVARNLQVLSDTVIEPLLEMYQGSLLLYRGYINPAATAAMSPGFTRYNKHHTGEAVDLMIKPMLGNMYYLAEEIMEKIAGAYTEFGLIFSSRSWVHIGINGPYGPNRGNVANPLLYTMDLNLNRQWVGIHAARGFHIPHVR